MKSLPKDRRIRLSQRNPGTKIKVDEKAEWLLLKDALKEFHDSARQSAEKPDSFWGNQRRKVLARCGYQSPVCHRRLIWSAATALVLVALGVMVLVERQQPVMPDFAAGYDQELLLDIDHALGRDVPAALEPGALLPEEIFPNGRITAAP
jgi:hypothetical protein